MHVTAKSRGRQHRPARRDAPNERDQRHVPNERDHRHVPNESNQRHVPDERDHLHVPLRIKPQEKEMQ